MLIICRFAVAPFLVLGILACKTAPLVLVMSSPEPKAVYMQLVICRSAVDASADSSLGSVLVFSPSMALAMSLVKMSQALKDVASLTEGSLVPGAAVFAVEGLVLFGPSISKYAPTTPMQSIATVTIPIMTFLFIYSPSLKPLYIIFAINGTTVLKYGYGFT